MTSISKNTKILLAILVILVVVYFAVIKKNKPEQSNLVSSTPVVATTGSTPINVPLAQDFLTELLNVKNINLDLSIFSDPAFSSLRDSSIVLVQDGTEGRPNPFAPIGSDITIAPPLITPNTISTPTSTTPAENAGQKTN